jgi:hypothetical protein
MKKDKIDLTEFNEIKIISTGYTRPGSHNAEEEANRLIKEGWVLLETYTTCYGNTPPLTSQQEVHLVLGRKKSVEQEEQQQNTLPA